MGETIGLELEVQGQEENVGPFRADILCIDTTNNHFVLIENQLEKTDGDFTRKNDWQEQHLWFKDNLEKFTKYFRPLIKKL